jgi:hypothetical protein
VLIYIEPKEVLLKAKKSAFKGGAHSFGHILTKKREISRTFALKKCELLSWPNFGQFVKSASVS